MKINSSHRLSKLLLISSWIPATLASACADNTNKSANKSDTSTNTQTKPSNPKVSESQTTPNNKTPETKPNSQQQEPPVNNQPAEDAEHMQSDQVQQHPQEQLKEVIVNLPFSESSTQYEAFKELVSKYNKWLENNEEAKHQGYYSVVTKLTNSYRNNLDSIKKQLATNDPNTPNLSFGYGSDIYQVNKATKLLNFASSTNEQDREQPATFADDKIDKGLFEDKLLTDESKIDGINQSGLYLLPLGVSTDLMYISKPVVNHFLKLGIETKRIQIDSKDEEWFKTTFGVSNTKTEDVSSSSSDDDNNYQVKDQSLIDSINSYYGASLGRTQGDADSSSTTVTISKSDFTSWTKLFKLINLMAEGFHTNNKPREENSNETHPNKHLASFNQTNLYEIMSFMNKDTDYSKFLWHRKDSSKTYNFDFLKDKESKEAQTLKTVYDLVAPAGKLGAYWSGKNNTTPSGDFQKGHLAFIFGSNVKYKTLYNPAYFPNFPKPNSQNLSLQKSDILVTNAPLFYDETSKSHASFNIQGGGMYGISSKDPARDHATRLFVKWLSTDSSKLALNNGSTMQSTEFNGFDYYALKSGYIPGSKNFWEKYAQNADKLLENNASKVTFSLFSKIIKPSLSSTAAEDENLLLDKSTTNIMPFVEPTGELTDAFRAVTDSNFSSDGKLPEFDEYWNTLNKNQEIQTYLNKTKS